MVLREFYFFRFWIIPHSTIEHCITPFKINHAMPSCLLYQALTLLNSLIANIGNKMRRTAIKSKDFYFACKWKWLEIKLARLNKIKSNIIIIKWGKTFFKEVKNSCLRLKCEDFQLQCQWDFSKTFPRVRHVFSPRLLLLVKWILQTVDFSPSK